MKGPPPALDPLFEKTDEWARRGDIDDHRILLISGSTSSPATMI